MYAGGKSFCGGPKCLMSCCGTLPLMPSQGETCVEGRTGRGASPALGFCQPSVREGQYGLVVLGYTPFPIYSLGLLSVHVNLWVLNHSG